VNIYSDRAHGSSQVRVYSNKALGRSSLYQSFIFFRCPPPSPLPWVQDPYAELAVFVDKVGVDGIYTACP